MVDIVAERGERGIEVHVLCGHCMGGSMRSTGAATKEAPACNGIGWTSGQLRFDSGAAWLMAITYR